MPAPFAFAHKVEFHPERGDEILRDIPAGPGIFALRGARDTDEPYLTRAADIRRRLRRLLAPPEAAPAANGDPADQVRPVLSKRLNLRSRVHFIEWTPTGSDFESTLLLYCATRAIFGPEAARKRLRLYPPYFLRVTMQHQHPRVYATNKLSARALNDSFGPFPSRAAAERFCDAVLDLFKLRRCHEDLQVHPDHPGCAYGEMKKCLEPCKAACTADVYADEAAAVRAFFATRGESMLAAIAKQRDEASENMDFEAAAALHKQWEKVRAAAQLADELVRPVAELRAVILQEAAPQQDGAGREDAAVFLLDSGRILGPDRLSTLGVRAVREQTAVGSSLFAQPLMLAAIPLEEPANDPTETLSSRPNPELAEGATDKPAIPSDPTETLSSRTDPELAEGAVERPALPTQASLSPEDRARAVIAALESRAHEAGPIDPAERADFLALFRRWYYRPEKQRTGEVFLPNPDATWPIRRILNGAARVVLGPPSELPPVEREKAREAAANLKTKVIHPGREGVERTVPVLPKRSRTRKSVTPADVLESQEAPETSS